MEEVTTLFTQQAADKGIELMNFVRYDVPDKLQGDPGRLRQIPFQPRRQRTQLYDEGRGGSSGQRIEQNNTFATLRFEVIDSGIGVDRETVGKLFKAFIQADASITRKYGGTGLGLALCKKFVDLMGGQIDVTSEVGREATSGSPFSYLRARMADGHHRSPAPISPAHGCSS